MLARLGRAFLHILPLATLLLVPLEWDGIPGQRRDTAAYHDAAAAARTGEGLYAPEPPGPHEFRGEWPFLYPPVLAAVLALTPSVSYEAFDRAWLILNVAAFWLLAIALTRLATGSSSPQATLSWGAALFLVQGSWLAIHFGNIDLMVAALLAWGLVLPKWSGGCYALGAFLKVAPVWPLGVLLVRQPAARASAALVTLACAATGILVFGIGGLLQQSSEWLTTVLPSVSQGQFWGGSLAVLKSGTITPLDILGNLSLSFLPLQLAVIGGWDYAGGDLPAPLPIYLTSVGIVVPLVVAWRTRARAANVQIASVAAAAVFAAPIVRPYVLPLILLVLAAREQERRLARSVNPEA